LATAFASFKKSGLKLSAIEFEEACDGLFTQPAPAFVEDGLTLYEQRLKRLCQKMGYSMAVEDLQATAMATVRSWADRMYLDPDCPKVLESLRKNYCLALITNYDHPPFIELVLRKFDLQRYFAEVIVSSLVGFAKPDPQIFQLALNKTALKPQEVVFVGDSFEDDVKGARAAGIQPVFIQREAAQVDSAITQPQSSSKPQIRPDNSAAGGVTAIRRLTDLLEML
jgi:HAD superfamily hydrolase (TIGR01549 family)